MPIDASVGVTKAMNWRVPTVKIAASTRRAWKPRSTRGERDDEARVMGCATLVPSRRAFKRTGVPAPRWGTLEGSPNPPPTTCLPRRAGGRKDPRHMYGTPEARALHARFPAIDFHADSL